nr:MAG TPA: hypothetical protein [Caudoviricetes sp.]
MQRSTSSLGMLHNLLSRLGIARRPLVELPVKT